MRRKPNRREFIAWGSAALGTSLLLKACGNNPTSTADSTPSERLKIAIALPGIISDQAWNQAGYAGIKQVELNLGAETAYVEKVGQVNPVKVLSIFAGSGYNLVYAHGGQFDTAVEQVASQFPKTFFVSVNGTVTGDNVAALQIDHLQASYLCGMIGAKMTKTNQMAYLTAESFAATDQELRGFELGAKSVNPKIKIISSYTGDWNDAAKAKQATETLINSGADVIYQWLDYAAPAVLQTASERGIYAFGNTVDQLEVAPNAVLTTPVKRIDLAIATLAKLAQEGKLEGRVYTFGLKQSNILYLGKFNKQVPPKVKQSILATEKAILADQLKFVSCQEEGKANRCVKGKVQTS